MNVKTPGKESLFNKYFTLVLVFSLISMTSNFVVNNLITKYADVKFGSAAVGGLLVFSYSISAIVSRFFTGYLTDHYGRRVLLILGTVLYAAGTFCLGIVGSIAALIILRFILGFLYAAQFTISATVSADTVSRSRLSMGTGLYWCSITLASAVGGVIASALSDSSAADFRVIFGGAAAGYLLATVIIAFASYEHDPDFHYAAEVREEHTEQPQKGLSRFLEKKGVPAGLVELLFSFGTGFYVSYFILFSQYRGFEHFYLFPIFQAAFGIMGSLLATRIRESTSSTFSLVFCCVLAAVGTLLSAVSASEILFFVCAAFTGFAMGVIRSVNNYLAVCDCPPNRRGAATTTYMIHMDLGTGLSGLVVGLVVGSNNNYIAAIYVSMAALLVGAVLSRFLFGKKAKA